MKKSILLLLASGCWILANGQSSSVQQKAVRAIGVPTCVRYANESQVGAVNKMDPSKLTPLQRQKRAQGVVVNRIKFGSCFNLFGVLDATCTQVSANQDLGMVVVTHRENSHYKNHSGALQADYSKDLFNTWDSNVVIYKNDSCRYPNGVILNPMGNLIDSNAFVVMSGPHTNGTDWDTNYFGSTRLNLLTPNTDLQRKKIYPGMPHNFTSPIFMQSCDDSTVHVIAPAYSLNGSSQIQAFYGAQLDDGVFSSGSNSVTWTQTVIRPHFLSYDGPSAPLDSAAEFTQCVYAWSQDGAIGYVVFFGNLDSVNGGVNYSFASLQPIVYKTSNHGATWAMMPLHNFRNDSLLTQFLMPTIDSPGVKLPFWDITGDGFHAGHDVDATVDVNGNLHIFGVIESAAIANGDSGGYTFRQGLISTMYLYDVHTLTAGGWAAIFIDSLKAPFGVEVSQSPWNYMGGEVWGSRVQASRSKDGKRIFCTWLDDPYGDSTTRSPDIYSVGINVTSNMMTAPVHFDSANVGSDYFLQVSNTALSTVNCSGGKYWAIPCMIIGNAESPNDGSAPINLYYVQNVGFCDSAFTVPVPTHPLGINEVVNTNSHFSVSPNYPNPFNKLTTFDVNLTETSTVAVDVYNMVGQKVMSIAPEKMATGKHIITINGSSFSSGIYFYRVTANGFTITHKMVVE